MKIIFIVGLLSQPRCIKRVSSFADNKYECEVYGYNRGNYDVNKYPESIKVNVLSQMENGKDYLRKFITIRRDINRILHLHKDEDVVYYSFSFIATLMLLIKRKKYIYEISDILYAYPKFSKIEIFLKKTDKILVKKSIATVLTSEGFKNYYNLNTPNTVVIPNKVSTKLRDIERVAINLNSNNIRFGFVGAIRYDSVLRFAEVIGKYYHTYSFHFYGMWLTTPIMEKVKTLTNNYPNIHFHGSYNNPQDLSRIYSELDVIVACYDVNSTNERIAEPNKLYESCLFCRPIIVSTNTYLAERVDKLKCGFAIDASNERSIKTFIDSISPKSLEDISKMLAFTNGNDYIDDESELFVYLRESGKTES